VFSDYDHLISFSRKKGSSGKPCNTSSEILMLIGEESHPMTTTDVLETMIGVLIEEFECFLWMDFEVCGL
jgi:hypothetical protein